MVIGKGSIPFYLPFEFLDLDEIGDVLWVWLRRLWGRFCIFLHRD